MWQKKELKESSDADIYFDYQVIKGGFGGAVDQVTFLIRRNPNYNTSKKHHNPAKDVEHKILIEQALALLDEETVTPRQVEQLLEEAEWNFQKLEDAYMLSRNQEEVRNLIGWLTTAIREGWAYDEPILTLNGDNSKKSKEYSNILKEFHKNESYQKDLMDFEERHPHLAGKHPSIMDETSSSPVELDIEHMTNEQKNYLLKKLLRENSGIS